MKRFVGSLMALSLLTAGAAFAVPQQHNDHDRDRNAQRYDQHGPDRRDDHRDDRHDDRRDDRHNAHHDDHRHGPPYRRGERLAPDHRATALPTTTSTMSSQRRAGTNGVVWITPTC